MNLFLLGFFYVKDNVYIYTITINKNNMKIYTVIPFYFDGIEIYETSIRSFKTFTEAENYANMSIDGRRYEIIENILD